MNILDIATDCGVRPVKVTVKEYACACPMCGGRDRFRLFPDKGQEGVFWCRGCGKKGDAIQLLIEAKGIGFKEACAYIGRDLPAGRRVSRTPTVPKKAVDGWTPRETNSPADLWRTKASAFAETAHKELLQNATQLEWLSARGITRETAVRFRLGWNPKDFWRERSAWGVAEEGKKIWVPSGLVIPCYAPSGELRRLRVRRLEGEPRYCVVIGSGMDTMIIEACPAQQGGRGVFIVVESELDAILIAQDAGDIVGVVAMGSSSTRPEEGLHRKLLASALILISLDSDTPGAKQFPWWRAHYPQADRWPVPGGKDPGDYRKAGGDIRAWILAGLPLGLRPYTPPPSNDVAKPETNAAPATTPSPSMGEGGGEGESLSGQGFVFELRCPAGSPSANEDITDSDLYSHLTRRAVVSCTRCDAKFEVRFAPGHKPYQGPCRECVKKGRDKEKRVRGVKIAPDKALA